MNEGKVESESENPKMNYESFKNSVMMFIHIDKKGDEVTKYNYLKTIW